MKPKSTLLKAMELLSGTISMKHIETATRRKHAYLPVHVCYGFPHKGSGKMAIITSVVNAQVYMEILDIFFIPVIENRFVDVEVIFSNENASWPRAKRELKTFR